MSEKYSKKPVELSHLSEEQIDQLIKRYYDGHKVSKLLTEFQIDTIPQKLVGLFPLLIHQDKPCPYCNHPMFTKLSSRNYFHYPPLDSDIVCGSCNHENLRFCNCDGCRDKEKKKKKDKLKTNREDFFNKFVKPDLKPVEYEVLTFKDRIYLGALLRAGLSEDFSSINSALNVREELTPTYDFAYEIFNYLYDKKIITLHPDSPIEAFEDEYYLNGAVVYMVDWRLNLKTNGKDHSSMVDQLLNPGGFQEGDIDSALEMWKRVALEECLQYLVYDIKINFGFDYSIGEKTKSVFTDLLQKCSTSQIFNIIRRCVEQALRYYNERNVSRRHAANSVVGKCQRFAERAFAEGWTLFNKSYRKKECPQSVISDYLYDRVLKIGDTGLYNAPSSTVLKKVFEEG